MSKPNKNQHYVPVFYFKQFSLNRKTVCLLLKKDGTIRENVSINDQCSQAYFYGDSDFERTTGKIESKISALFDEIIRKEQLPAHHDERLLLCMAVTLQYSRTLKHRSNFPGNAIFKNSVETVFEAIAKRDMESGKYSFLTKEFIDSVKVQINEKAIHMSHLGESVLSGATLLDLNCCLLVNSTERDFIFSDSPVVYFNQAFSRKSGNIGNFSRGLQIFYPLSPKLTLLMYDDHYYDITSKKGIVVLSQKNDIEKINGLQLHNANETLYFSNHQQAILVQNLWNNERTRFNEPCALQGLPIKNTNGEITEKCVIGNNSAFQYPLNLSFMKPKRTHVPRIYNPIDYVRDQQLGKRYISAMETLKRNVQIFKNNCPEYFGLDPIEHELFIRAIHILFKP